MERFRAPLFAVVVFCLDACWPAGVCSGEADAVAESQMKPMGNMPMDPHSMKDCMEHQQAAMKSIDDMNTTMEAAKQSNDPDKMRAAIDHAQKQLLGMNEHMTMCRNMMSMMEKMQGMGEMMKGGSK